MRGYTTFKPVLNKDGRQNKSGLYTIYIRVTLNGRSKYLNVGEKVSQSSWSGKEGAWIKSGDPISRQLNIIIDKHLLDLRQFRADNEMYRRPVDLRDIENFFYKGGFGKTFNEYANGVLKNVRGRELNTLKVYNTFLKHLNAFNSNIQFNQVGDHLFQAFAKWLHEEKNLAGSSVHKYFKPFHIVCRQATKDKLFERDPFELVSISDTVKNEKSKKRIHLEKEEITLMKNFDLSQYPDLEITRRHWLFCFYAGFYYSDLKKLRWNEIKNSEFGYCIVAKRFKNESYFASPIHKFKHAIEILEDQKGKDPELVFPDTISEQKYNARLKLLAKEIKLKKNLMNKTARHSLVQFWKAQGLSTSHLGKMVGHSNENTTKQYFELSPSDVNQHVSKFDFSELDI